MQSLTEKQKKKISVLLLSITDKETKKKKRRINSHSFILFAMNGTVDF